MRHLVIHAVAATLLMGGDRLWWDSNEPYANNGSMSGLIDGGAWNPVSITTQVNEFQTIMAITGVDASGRTLKLTFPIGAGTGTQTIGQGNAGHAQLTISTQIWVVTNVGYGTLALTMMTPGRVVGAFDLTMQGSSPSVTPAQRRVTGDFDVRY